MSWLSATTLLVALVGFGLIAGGLVATRVIGTSGMGWDQIADTLGGLAAGAVLALAVWIVVVRTVGPAGRLWISGAAVVGCAGASIYLVMTPPRARVVQTREIPAPTVETFAWQMGVADGIAGPPSESDRLPWEFLRIASNLSLDYVPVNDANRQCIAADALNTPEGIAALTELRAILSALPGNLDCGEPCPTCMEVSLQWYLNDDRATAMITDRCWRSHEQLQPLRASVEGLFATYSRTATCSVTTP